MTRKHIADISAWPSLDLEGNLITHAMIAKIDQRDAPEQKPEDYAVRKGLTFREEIATAFRVGQSHFDTFNQIENPSYEATKRFVKNFFSETFGYNDLQPAVAPIALIASERVPVVIVPHPETLDRRSPTLSDERACSAAGALQDFLNDKDKASWGIVTNFRQLRLMRVNASLTRPAYIEADLSQIFLNEDIASFSVLWLLIHRSRFGVKNAPARDCALERWRDMGSREGEVARDRLAGQVTIALKVLGSGFLAANADLATKLKSGEANLTEWFNELLRLVYRLIFLMVAEDRDLLHPKESKPEACDLYKQGYSLSVLRKQCYRAATWDKHHDRFEGIKIVFSALAHGQEILALPALGGLFASDQMKILQNAILRNNAFMEALYRLSWIKDKAGMVPINWRAMETEELGSVYESLLELQPQLADGGKSLTFASDTTEQKGNQRRITGSYYTPDSLVQALLDTALDPVLDKIEAEADNPEIALLKLSIIDPACGSGHFLLGASRRIATRLARIRVEGTPSLEDFRHALREVASCCIHGVDLNPMAVELTKVALWIETIDPGLPLGYFDAQIRCGNSLIGVFDLEMLKDGIPDAAYKPLIGDDKITAEYYLKANRDTRVGQGGLNYDTGKSFLLDMKPLALNFAKARDLPEKTIEQINDKAKRFQDFLERQDFMRLKMASDLYVASFLQPKKGDVTSHLSDHTVSTTENVWEVLEHGNIISSMEDALITATQAYAFHWKLEFPDVMEKGGFDVVLGNPPWKKYTILKKEFFANIPEIAVETNAAKRQKAIEDKLKNSPNLAYEWNEAQREMSAKVEFVRGSGRFPQSAVGELNRYPLFAELGISIVQKSGWAGLVLKSLMFTGSTWKNFTDKLISSGRLHSVFEFKNKEMLFSSVGSSERYALVTIGPPQESSKIHLAVGLTNPLQLADGKSIIDIDREFPRRVNPETGTLPQCETLDDFKILSRIANRFSTLGKSNWNARYSSGLHMTGDVAQLRDRETLEEQGFRLKGSFFIQESEEYVPVYEGKFIHQYDHRFATFDGTPAKKRFGVNAKTITPTDSEKLRRDFEIIPRYWVQRSFFAENTLARGINLDWNIGFRDTTNVISNYRTAVGCIIGATAFNYKCPNIMIEEGDDVASALFLSMFNSVPYDYLLRQKFYGSNFTKSILLQTFVVKRETLKDYEEQILDAVADLTNTSNSVSAFANALGREDRSVLDLRARLEIRAWIDALYFKLFGFEFDEMVYVFDTFSIWEEKSTKIWGKFLEKERTLALFRDLKIRGSNE